MKAFKMVYIKNIFFLSSLKTVRIKACMLSRVLLFMTPWTVACQAPLSMGFSRQEDWSELPFPPPGDLPRPGIEPSSPALAAGFFTTEPPGKLDCSLLRSSERHRPKGSDNGLHYLHPENVIETPDPFFLPQGYTFAH